MNESRRRAIMTGKDRELGHRFLSKIIAQPLRKIPPITNDEVTRSKALYLFINDLPSIPESA
jgi:hypothetical protein